MINFKFLFLCWLGLASVFGENEPVIKPLILAADHGGFVLKEEIRKYLQEQGIPFIDVGTYSSESVDYPDVVEKAVDYLKDPETFGIFICGTGQGMTIAANRHSWIRATLCHHDREAALARQHNNANVLCLGGRTMGVEIAKSCVKKFLKTDFEGGRHQRRLDKIG